MSKENFYLNFEVSGNTLLLRKIENGERVSEEMELSPVLYHIDPNNDSPEFVTFDGDPLSEIQFPNVFEAYKTIREHKESSGSVTLHGFNRFEYNKIDELYPGTQGIEYDESLINVLYFDIESECEEGFPDIESANEKINAITVYFKGTYYSFGLKDVNVKKLQNKGKRKVKYRSFDSEYDMLKKFIDLWRKIDPDILTGWNIQFFDIPYLVHRIRRILGEEYVSSLSPWGDYNKRTTKVMNKDQDTYEFVGIATLDYLDVYKKFVLKMQESYRLDHIAYVELGENKIDYSEFDSLHELYKHDYQKFIDYNIKDVELIVRLEEKKKLLSIALFFAYQAKVNYQDIFMNIRLWDVIISNYSKHAHGVQVPSYKTGFGQSYKGGYVRPTQPGKYDWVVSFDLTSLYPSLIIQYNISPETIVRHHHVPLDADDVVDESKKFNDAKKYSDENDYAMACNGSFFKKDEEGILPNLMKLYFDFRKKTKKQKIEEEKKINMIKEILKERGEDDGEENNE